MSGFRVKFTLPGGTGIATSPPSDTLELALERGADLERSNKVTIQGIEGPDGEIILDHEGYRRRRPGNR